MMQDVSDNANDLTGDCTDGEVDQFVVTELVRVIQHSSIPESTISQVPVSSPPQCGR